MLTAKARSTGEQVIAKSTTKTDGPFLCPECENEVVLKVGTVRLNHFAHKSATNCEYGKGETEAHRKCKLAIYEALLKEPNVKKAALERSLVHATGQLKAIRLATHSRRATGRHKEEKVSSPSRLKIGCRLMLTHETYDRATAPGSASVRASDCGDGFRCGTARTSLQPFAWRNIGHLLRPRMWPTAKCLTSALTRCAMSRMPFALYVRNDNHAAKLVKLIAQCGPLDIDDERNSPQAKAHPGPSSRERASQLTAALENLHAAAGKMFLPAS